jgi:hypothetical protein
VSCSLDGASLGFCSSATTQQYTGLIPGPHTFLVQAADAAGNLASASYSWTIQSAPFNTAAPSISGNPSQGSQLTASPGSWTGAPTFAYQWFDCDVSGASCAPISGAMSSTYTVQAADAGFTLVVSVTATNSLGSSVANSAATAVVASSPVNTGVPSISGTATQGSQLTASPGTWTGVPAPAFAYQWTDCDSAGANCKSISGATHSTYTLAGSDVGATLRVVVVASNSAGFGQARSSPTAVVTAVVIPPPVLSGVSQSHKTWREAPKPASKRKLPTGTVYAFTLNVPGSVSFRFTLKTNGRKVGGHCRKQTSHNRLKPGCKLKLAAGTLVVSAHKGANKVSFAGRLHNKKLHPGAYTVAITATAAGKMSKTSTLKFTIAP